MSEFGPAFTGELSISCADGVGMDAEAAGEFARAGKAIAGTKISRKNRKDNLRDQLAIDGHFARRGEPESHGSLGAIFAASIAEEARRLGARSSDGTIEAMRDPSYC